MKPTLFTPIIVGSLALALALTGCSAVDSAMEAGQGAIEAGQQAVQAGQEAIDTGKQAVDTAQDTVQAADDLLVACDIVREAVRPGVAPEESASLFQEAMAIVSGVVIAYPDVAGIDELEAGLAAAREALAADPSGATLGITGDLVESTCSRIPSLG